MLAAEAGVAHPLRLSLCEIEHASAAGRLTISLRLFVMDVNEAIVFDPDSKALSLGLPDEAPNAEALLMNYLNRFFEVRANGEKIDLRIQSKRLKGEGDNTALAVEFEHTLDAPLAPWPSGMRCSPTCSSIRTISCTCTWMTTRAV